MPLLASLIARKRLLAGIGAGLATLALLPASHRLLTRALLAWDLGALLFLVLIAAMFSSRNHLHLPRDAAAQEEGEWTIFAATLAGVTASFAAIVGEFALTKAGTRLMRYEHLGLIVATLLLSWLVTQTLFALRYAHEYYSSRRRDGKPDGGLQFPGEHPPDYWDFAYFSLVLGMTFQVSDVQIVSRKLRRLALLHGFMGFVFNTVIIALSVNVGASLL
ncbi:MAG: DUF1345 domain-containing protein [Rhodospirillales bacterium]|nr:DUF1345 domain-containing protein [Rhodospirillales bacterium]